MPNDLNAMTLSELKKLQTRVEKAISTLEKRRKKQARAAMEKVAKDFGLTMNEVLGNAQERPGSRRKAGRKPKAKSAPKFRNPENPDQTWSGRGRRPEWYKSAMAAGKTDKDLAI